MGLKDARFRSVNDGTNVGKYQQIEREELTMSDADIIKGKAKQVEGKVQDAVGDLTNSPKDDVRGKAKVAEGKVQEKYGKATSDVDAMDRDDHV